ncbi:MAG TPA: hypothetical protein VIM48_09700 [Chthoniobacterales bacterium]
MRYLKDNICGALLGPMILLICAGLAIVSALSPQSDSQIKTTQLVGNWNGEESWGTKWKISRKSDRTFSQLIDFRESDVPHNPPVVRAEGRFFIIDGSMYGYFYTKSSDPRFLDASSIIRKIEFKTPDRLTYQLSDGNWVTECREKIGGSR